MNNPILKNPRNIFFYILFWMFEALAYFLLISLGLNIEIKFSIVDSIVFNILLAGLGLSFWYPARYISVEDNFNYKIFLKHLISGIISSCIWLLVGFLIINNFVKAHGYSEFFYSTLGWRFFIGLLFYFLITAFYYIIIYYNSLQEKILKESELRNLVTESELKSLKFQINPHFIFNSLNSMSALTTIDPDRARSMILKLADFLRYTLANNGKEKNRLEEELKNINLYLDIEKIRFEDKFDYIEQIDNGVLDLKVPNMILQPLFENAIKHAVYDSLGKITIKLKCSINNNFLRISLENNFEDGYSKKGAGIGLQNIKSRLELIYGQKNLVDIKKEDNIFNVILYIPV
ncbi:MAG: histidine kinase [Ignavibacteriaceae bacterium]|nr:histidine kinase [Ignavibacteriaceae bacterium]